MDFVTTRGIINCGSVSIGKWWYRSPTLSLWLLGGLHTLHFAMIHALHLAVIHTLHLAVIHALARLSSCRQGNTSSESDREYS
jgi:hypothetical protein